MPYNTEEKKARDKSRKACRRLPGQLDLMTSKMNRIKADISPWDKDIESSLQGLVDTCNGLLDSMKHDRDEYDKELEKRREGLRTILSNLR